jgi:NhaA family Na+:H+ antiporter
VRTTGVYITLGVGVWLAVFASGIHATIAGVVLGLLTPTVAFYRGTATSALAHRLIPDDVDEGTASDSAAWLELADLSWEAVSPLARLERLLHPWTSFVIVPLFALANAGVDLGGTSPTGVFQSRTTLGIVVGLVAGKGIGITAAAWLATRAGFARLPEGVRWSQVGAIAVIAGIGFTVSLFIAGLAFPGDRETLEAAKIGILAGTTIAGLVGAVFLRLSARARPAGPAR